MHEKIQQDSKICFQRVGIKELHFAPSFADFSIKCENKTFFSLFQLNAAKFAKIQDGKIKVFLCCAKLNVIYWTNPFYYIISLNKGFIKFLNTLYIRNPRSSLIKAVIKSLLLFEHCIGLQVKE